MAGDLQLCDDDRLDGWLICEDGALDQIEANGDTWSYRSDPALFVQMVVDGFPVCRDEHFNRGNPYIDLAVYRGLGVVAFCGRDEILMGDHAVNFLDWRREALSESA